MSFNLSNLFSKTKLPKINNKHSVRENLVLHADKSMSKLIRGTFSVKTNRALLPLL